MLDGDSAIQKLLELRFELGEFGRLFPIEPAMKRCGHVAFYDGTDRLRKRNSRAKLNTHVERNE